MPQGEIGVTTSLGPTIFEVRSGVLGGGWGWGWGVHAHDTMASALNFLLPSLCDGGGYGRVGEGKRVDGGGRCLQQRSRSPTVPRMSRHL